MLIKFICQNNHSEKGMTFSWRGLHSHSGTALVKDIIFSAASEIINMGTWLKTGGKCQPKTTDAKHVRRRVVQRKYSDLEWA